jgi:hypothetical protein
MNWQAPNNTTLPDFIICGAMKSGTTTLHAMLNLHPDISLPAKELHFFDCDNVLQHPDFSFYYQKQWHNLAFNQAEPNWQWYSAQFQQDEGKVVGEDSTTYLASPLAARRIAQQQKPIKIIIMLRQPAVRAYSHYWHLVRTGRAIYDFETMLQLNPLEILGRSLYLQQINHFLSYIPKERIKFIIFEEFLQNKAKTLQALCNFLGVDYQRLPEKALTLHENATNYPKYYRLQLVKNRLFPMAGNVAYLRHFAEVKHQPYANNVRLLRLINAIHRKVNPLIAKKCKALSPETKHFLDNFFKNELDGINQVLEKDVTTLWFGSAD